MRFSVTQIDLTVLMVFETYNVCQAVKSVFCLWAYEIEMGLLLKLTLLSAHPHIYKAESEL